MSTIHEVVGKQRIFFEKGITKGIDYRISNLTLLKQAVLTHEKEIIEALQKDLNKAPFEAYATEIGIVLEELEYVIKHLRNWAKPRKVKTPITHFLSVSRQYAEPYGIVLIMSPWNYPFQLTIAPLIGSIAAGNCTIVKPSEYSSHTAAIIEQLINENFDDTYITVVRGGREANKTLLDEKFDYIFFTGSVSVGKVVMESASKHLTPVSLELGGKSPCIVDESANLDMAARRIVWGKFLNAGQTCVAPDYLLVHKSVKNALITKMNQYIEEFYGSDPLSSPDYPKIINDKHFNRLLRL
ncbi:MAG TPA: aldehyde dehydrogenase family protein, partial [Firmicutes bacterium]|nr:aldehyde dehydrogenase family protein [Bacillota bacterium]